MSNHKCGVSTLVSRQNLKLTALGGQGGLGHSLVVFPKCPFSFEPGASTHVTRPDLKLIALGGIWRAKVLGFLPYGR